MLFARSGPGRDYERLVVVSRPPLRLRAIIAIHSTQRGSAFGGIRRRVYPSEEAALADALALSEAMSHKCALAGLRAGGAKTVILDDGETSAEQWSAAYQALGAAIEQLRGEYVCGPDLGTGVAELAAVRTRCTHVNPEGNDAGLSTAAGVHAGLRAVAKALGRPLPSQRVAIQGLGSVGFALARALRAEGVAVVAADPSAEACRSAATLGVEIVDPEALLYTPCDILSPCALGHILDRATIEGLRCRAVCGSANNQLAGEGTAEHLRAHGVLHAPDVVVSAGAVIEGVLTVQHGGTAAVRDRVAQAIAGIEGTLAEVFAEAQRHDLPPSDAAQRLARAALA